MSAVTQKVVKTRIPARMDRLPWTRWHWLVIVSLGFVWVLDGLEVTIKGAVGASLKESIGFTTVQVAGAASIYLFGAISGALFWAYLTDRFGRQKLFIVTLSVYLVGVVGTSITGLWFTGDLLGDYWWFAVFRFITGFGIGGEYAAIHSAVDELVPARVRGWVDLVIAGSYWLGAAVAAVLGPLYLDVLFGVQDGWRYAFLTGGVVAIGLLLLRLFVPESPRWLITHGYAEAAEETVGEIERRVADDAGMEVEELGEPPEDDAIELRQRRSIGFVEIAKTAFVAYPRRAIAGFSIMVTQAFLYNAIFFTYGLMLTQFFGLSSASVGFFLIPFAISNFLGPLVLGRLFDTRGRKAMIPVTFWIAGVTTIATGLLFATGIISSAWLLTACWMLIFFFASAAASAGYLTVSETFPLEIRAMAIAFFYASATAAGGIIGPILFGNLIEGGRWTLFWGYVIGGGLMLLGGLAHRIYGVEAAQQGLESVAAPLTAEEAEDGGGPPSLTGPAGVDPTAREPIAQFQRDHGLADDGVIGAETMGALRAVGGDGDRDEEEITVVDVLDPASVRRFQERNGLEPDGVVGPETQGAIRAAERRIVVDVTDADSVCAFQRAHALAADGLVGPRTQAALRAVLVQRADGESGVVADEVDVLEPDAVRRFQRAVGLEDDGDVGPRTRGALKLERARREVFDRVDPTDAGSVRAFQAAHGLAEDGVVGPETQAALRRQDDELIARRRDARRRRPRRLFGVDPADGDSVRRFQREHDLAPDGVIGAETRRVLRRQAHLLAIVDPTDPESVGDFQRRHGLAVDGVLGPQTRGALRALRAERDPAGIHEESDEEREHADDEQLARRIVPIDPLDERSVRRFQAEHGLEEDGCIGPRTQAALRAVARERELEQLGIDLPRPERRRPVRTLRSAHVYTPALMPVSGPGEDREFDAELDQVVHALERAERPLSRRELGERTRARLWGPGRLRYVLGTAEREGIIRRVGHDRYAVVR
jgi:murein L,D-transpeptidase YcbB/YkuD/MFS family permease